MDGFSLEKDFEHYVKTLHIKLAQSGQTVAVAESCTGGLLGAALTVSPGSSQYFLGGVICYANFIKTKILGVDQSDLIHHGAVSETVVAQMAEGVARMTGATIALAISGIAGPDGGSAEKPVGTVWFGIHSKKQKKQVQWTCTGDRHQIRTQAMIAALKELEHAIESSV